MEKKFLRLKEVFFAVQWDNSQKIYGVSKIDEQEIKTFGPYCQKCGKHLNEHGLLITAANGREYVCPGNWLIKSDKMLVEYHQYKNLDEFVCIDDEINKKLNES